MLAGLSPLPGEAAAVTSAPWQARSAGIGGFSKRPRRRGGVSGWGEGARAESAAAGVAGISGYSDYMGLKFSS